MKKFCSMFLISLMFLLSNFNNNVHADVVQNNRGGWIYSDTEKSKDISKILTSLTNVLKNYEYEWKWFWRGENYVQEYVPKINSDRDAFEELGKQLKKVGVNEVDQWLNCIESIDCNGFFYPGLTKKWEYKFQSLVDQIKKCGLGSKIELYPIEREERYLIFFHKTIIVWRCVNL